MAERFPKVPKLYKYTNARNWLSSKQVQLKEIHDKVYNQISKD